MTLQPCAILPPVMIVWGKSLPMRAALTWAGRVRINKRRNSTARRLRSVETLVNLDPTNATLQLELTDTLFNIARIHEQLGDMSEALQLLQQRLAIQEQFAKKQAPALLPLKLLAH